MVAITLLSSCEKYLDTTATDIYNEDNWWKTESQALSSLNGCYETLMSSYIGGTSRLTEENISPNSYNMSGDVVLATGSHDSGNDTRFLSKWDQNYEGVGRTNNFLANIDRPTMSEVSRNQMKGEAYFLRAFYYFNLVNYFGGVPLILDSPDLSQKNLPRNSKTEVLNKIYSDLDSAILLLPVSYQSNSLGRATKGAALSLKARVSLYQSDWNSVVTSTQAVMDLDQYELYGNYRNLFLPNYENNVEVIFDVQYYSPYYVNGFDNMIDVQLNMAPTKDLVDSYYMSDGEPISESSLYDPEHPYDNRDLRLLQTIVIPGYQWRGAVAQQAKYFSTGYGFKKYSSYTDNQVVSNVLNSEINYIFIRYADVLLMYAEAKNELNDVDNSVYQALNLIRTRAGLPNVDETLSQSELRDLIRHERRIELAGEGLYYDDIRRWRTAETVNNADVLNSAGAVVQTRTFDASRDYLWPIHNTTLQENPSLEQNDGYEH